MICFVMKCDTVKENSCEKKLEQMLKCEGVLCEITLFEG